MKPITTLFNTCQGRTCTVVGRGLSAHATPCPKTDDVIAVNAWPGQSNYKMDYYIFSDLLLFEMHLASKEVFPPGVKVIGPTPVISWATTKRLKPESIISYSYDPHEYPLKLSPMAVAIRSGARALMLALDMGYDKVYLVGFDYKPMENYDSPDMVIRPESQLQEYKLLQWPRGRIVQTNSGSLLQFTKEVRDDNSYRF